MNRVARTVRLPIERVDDDTWRNLRRFACQAARFGNLMLAQQFAAKMAGVDAELRKAVDRQVWAESREELSGWVRNAMAQKCRGYWQRSAKDVLSGRERPACYSGDRALAIQADMGSNRGVLYERNGEDFVLACRFEPVRLKGGGTREPVRLKVALDSPGARKDWYIREAVESIWSGAWKPGIVTLRFDRRRRKLDALVSYTKPGTPALEATRGATLGPYVPETGELWLRFDGGEDEHADWNAARNFAGRLNRMLDFKRDHAQIVHRLRRRIGRGPRRRQVYRRKLAQIGDFSVWARGEVHRLSRDIVDACRKHGVSELRLADLGVGDLPWHQLRADIRYKSQDAGITVVDPSVAQNATERAKKAEIQKRTRRIRKARTGVAATRELIGT